MESLSFDSLGLSRAAAADICGGIVDSWRARRRMLRCCETTWTERAAPPSRDASLASRRQTASIVSHAALSPLSARFGPACWWTCGRYYSTRSMARLAGLAPAACRGCCLPQHGVFDATSAPPPALAIAPEHWSTIAKAFDEWYEKEARLTSCGACAVGIALAVAGATLGVAALTGGASSPHASIASAQYVAAGAVLPAIALCGALSVMVWRLFGARRARADWEAMVLALNAAGRRCASDRLEEGDRVLPAAARRGETPPRWELAAHSYTRGVFPTLVFTRGACEEERQRSVAASRERVAQALRAALS